MLKKERKKERERYLIRKIYKKKKCSKTSDLKENKKI